jgi:hypothetical protein
MSDAVLFGDWYRVFITKSSIDLIVKDQEVHENVIIHPSLLQDEGITNSLSKCQELLIQRNGITRMVKTT